MDNSKFFILFTLVFSVRFNLQKHLYTKTLTSKNVILYTIVS